MRNLLYENEFCVQLHFHANQSHFHKNGFALRLALKQRHKGTRKWSGEFLQEDTLVKPNKWQTDLCQPLKGKLKLFRFKIVKYKTRAFNRKIEIKSIPILLISLTANNHFWCCCPFFASDLMHSSTGYVVKQLVYAFICALSSYGALGKFGEHSRS